jgi:hypothetical protein
LRAQVLVESILLTAVIGTASAYVRCLLPQDIARGKFSRFAARSPVQELARGAGLD